MSRRLGPVVLCACLALAVGAPGWALDPEVAITQYVQNVWRAPGTLPHDDVTSILQTRDSYLWIGTVEGLARFDGVRSVVFDKSNTPAFANNWVKALLEDRAGRLWVGTLGGGLVCLENGRFVRFGAAEGLSADVISALYEDRAGQVWVGTSGEGLFRFQEGRFVRAPGTEAIAARSVRALVEDRDGRLWIGTETGLFHYLQGVTTRLPRESGWTSETILSLAADDGGLWIGTEEGLLHRFVDGRVSAIAPRERLARERIWSLALDHDGNLWIGTDGGGLGRLSRGVLTTFDTRNGLTNDFVWALYEDREGSLWIGTNGGGLNRLKNGAVVALTTREGLPSDFIWSVLRSRDGSLWIGTEDAGVVRIRDGRLTTYSTREGLEGSARALVERADGTLWIGGDGGLFVWDAGRIRSSGIVGHADDVIQALAEDPSGTLWIGTVSRGLMALAGGRLRRLSTADGLSSDSVTALLPARDGALWIGPVGGLDRRQSDGRLTALTSADGLPANYVTALFEGPDGALWVATRGGLARVQNGGVASVTAAHGLLDDALMSALPGNDGAIWMGSNRGLFRAPRAEIEAVMAGRRDRLSSRSFGLEDGLRSVEVNSSGSSRWKDADGRLWFATRGGVAAVDPGRRRTNPLPPPVAIEEVVADGRTLPAGGGWRLPAATQRIEFHYTALSFVSIPGTRLRHRLEGFDPDWIAAEADRTAYYTSLPHGRYRFRVIAANSDGVWNQEGASVAFEIAPRLHETIWFRALAVLIFAFLGPLFYLARVRSLRDRQAELERLVAERTAQVEAANARLEQLAHQDSLTGVANRRLLDETLDEEWRRGTRLCTPVALLLIDVDLFKAFNDRLGHLAGDAGLQAIATTLAETCRRAGEFVARYGGEEFAVLLPGAARSDALAAAEKVRRNTERLALPHPASTVAPVVTVSVGVAWADPSSGGTAVELLHAADRALYRAKQNGRNRVESGEL